MFLFSTLRKKINYFCQKGSIWMFSRQRAWVGQVWCLMFAPCCLQAVVSDEHDAKGLVTLKPRTSQHSLMFAFRYSLFFSNAGLNLLCAEIWCSERNKTAQPKKHPACLCCVESPWLSVTMELQCRHNALLYVSKTHYCNWVDNQRFFFSLPSRELPDDPKAEWSVPLVSSVIVKHIRAHSFNMVHSALH